MNLHSLEPESSASADSATSAYLSLPFNFTQKRHTKQFADFAYIKRLMNTQHRYVTTLRLKCQSDYNIIFSVKRMKKTILTVVSASAVLFTLWYMQFGSLTENSGALSKTGLTHPVYFAIWGTLVFFGIYGNLLYSYKKTNINYKFKYFLCAASAIGMIVTVCCDFDYAKPAEYLLHCCGALIFSAATGTCVFLLFLFNYKKSRMFALFTYIIGLILVADFILLLIFKENALIEAVPVLFALIILPVLNVTNLFKEKEYASR